MRLNNFKTTLTILNLLLCVSCVSKPLKPNPEKIESNDFSPPHAVSDVIRSAKYRKLTIDLENTKFVIYARVSGGIGLDRIERSLAKIWKSFSSLPKKKITTVWIVDAEGPLGGGPLAPYSLGLYFSKSIAPQFQDVLFNTLGWKKLASTQAYINKYYAKFNDPTQAYVEDMLTHELAHVFFGFGLTSEPRSPLAASWFSLGMGMVYDRQAWDEHHSSSSPLFDGIIRQYQEKYSKIEKIDQRLINPDTTQDDKYNLARTQIFAHAKSYLFLNSLRNTISPVIFDKAVIQYLSQAPGSKGGYSEFVEFLPKESHETLKYVEEEFKIR